MIFDLEILRKLKDSKKDICLAVDKKSRLNGTMRIKTRKNYVVDIGNQIKTKQSSGNFIGFAKFSKKGCDNIKKNLVKYKFSNYRDYYTFALKGLMKNNKVYFEDFSYYWKEIDTYKDLIQAKKINNEIEKKEKEKYKNVYMALSADILHEGHIRIINKASKLGKITIGLLTDEAIASFKNIPFLNYNQRYAVVKNIKEIDKVVPQTTLDYTNNLRKLKPEIVVHGDDWKKGVLKNTRQKVIQELKSGLVN